MCHSSPPSNSFPLSFNIEGVCWASCDRRVVLSIQKVCKDAPHHNVCFSGVEFTMYYQRSRAAFRLGAQCSWKITLRSQLIRALLF